MSPRERTSWIHLVSILVVFVPYFRHVLVLFQGDGPVARSICIAFLGAALAHAVLNAIGLSVATLIFGREILDERDRAIDALSLRVAYYALIALVLGALSTMAFLGAITRPSASGSILMPGFALTSQYVFFSFVAAEVLRHATRLVCYRRATLA